MQRAVPQIQSYSNSSSTSIKRAPRGYAQEAVHARTMDSQLMAHIFRQLFRHRSRGCLHNLRHHTGGGASSCTSVSNSSSHAQAANQRRQSSTIRNRASRDRGMKSNESRWQQRTTLFPQDRTAEFNEYPELSSRDLKARTERPRKCKMLLRDFVDGRWMLQWLSG